MTQDDQLVDVGGGTAEISLMLKRDLGITKPVVCVEPSLNMLKVAEQKGARGIHCGAEEFFATKPDFPLDVVLMMCCVHHFKDRDFVFTKLAEYMPETGRCAVVQTDFASNLKLPWFKGGKDYPIAEDMQSITKLCQSKGFKCELVCEEDKIQLKKQKLYTMFRERFRSTFRALTDQQLEEGIQKLEDGDFKGLDTVEVVMGKHGLLMTKQ